MSGLFLSINASRSVKFPRKTYHTLGTVRGGDDLDLKLPGLLFDLARDILHRSVNKRWATSKDKREVRDLVDMFPHLRGR